MKKFLGLLIIFLMISSSCFGRTMYGEISPELLDDMYKKPSKYIDLGCIGMGTFFYMDKTSVRVDKYEPPNYIIAFREIPLHDKGNSGKDAYDKDNNLVRYRYDFVSRKMYREWYRNGDINQPFWKEIDSDVSHYSGRTGDSTLVWLAEGEVAFYLAYNMSFYENPISSLLKEYLKTGKWNTFRN